MMGSLGWGAISSLLCFPHSLAYFNELIGGPARGHRYLSGTNIDWGHNVFYLREEVKRRNWTSFASSLWVSYDLKLAGFEEKITKVPRLPKPIPSSEEQSAPSFPVLIPGRYAVSACIVQGTIAFPAKPISDDPLYNGYTYFQEFVPIGHTGHSIWLYELSEDDILGSKSWGGAYREYLEHSQTMSEP
jgi:hypothetical protein